MKTCTKCKETKPLDEFNKNKRKRDGLEIYCRSCERERGIKRLREKGVKPMVYTRRDENGKLCTKCGTIKSWEDFNKDKNRSDGYGIYCRSCTKDRLNKHYHGKGKFSNKKWREENKEKIKKVKRKNYIKKWDKYKQYREDNWEYILKYNNDYRKNRMKHDKLFMLRIKFGSAIANAFRERGYSKDSSTAEILGCSWKTLKKYMENQFTEGMKWGNYGEWHVDHIIPKSTAKTKEELIRLNHYTNLQPLWAEDNLRKSDKMPE